MSAGPMMRKVRIDIDYDDQIDADDVRLSIERHLRRTAPMTAWHVSVVYDSAGDPGYRVEVA